MDTWDRNLAHAIDHTLLKADATEDDIEKLCLEAKKYGFASAVVFPWYVPLAAELMAHSGIPVCSVISFPFGAHGPEEKAREAQALLRSGAGELDMVMNISAFLSGKLEEVNEELRLVGSLCRGKAVSKLIIETAYLDRDGIVRASEMGADAGFDFIKTSTGFAPRGASVDDVQLIYSTVGKRSQVKAAGGIRTREFAKSLVGAGAKRLGCSWSLEIIAW